jgi:hypothetical protein
MPINGGRRIDGHRCALPILRIYGLRLPAKTIEPGHGARNAERCLTALALFAG